MTSEGRAGVGEGSTGRRGGAEALRSTALVATGGFGHWAGARQDGRSGHPWATPRPAGGSGAQGQRDMWPSSHANFKLNLKVMPSTLISTPE